MADAPASRAAVFQAADFLADTGSRVTVSSVRHELGGGDGKRIRELLIEWRERRQKPADIARIADPPEYDPTVESEEIFADTDLWPGLSAETAAAGDWPGRTLATPSSELPVELADQIDRLRDSLAEIWTRTLAGELVLDDQMSVIRAAAEAKVREAQHRADAAEQELDCVKSELIALRTERAGIAAAIEHKVAPDAARRARAETGPSNDNRTGETLVDRLAEAEQANEALTNELAGLRCVLRDLRDRARAIGGGPVGDIDGGVVTALFREGPAEADAEAIRAALRTADADRERLASERVELSRDREELQRDLSELRARLDRQSDWIDKARSRMTRAGLIKSRKRPGPGARG